MSYKIYILTEPNNRNKIRYVGLTRRSLLMRLGAHLSRKDSNKNKIKWIESLEQAPLIFEIASYKDKDEAFKDELYFIEMFRSFGFNLVNGIGIVSYKSSKRVSVDKYDLEGNLIESDIHPSQFVKNTGNIIRAIRQGTASMRYRWSYHNEKLKGKDIVIIKNRVYANGIGKIVYQYDLKGYYIKSYINARSAKGFNYKNISQVCLGQKMTHKKYRWSFKKVKKLKSLPVVYKKAKSINKYKKDGTFIKTFVSPKHVLDNHKNFVRSSLVDCIRRNAINNGNSIYKGYIWKYKV